MPANDNVCITTDQGAALQPPSSPASRKCDQEFFAKNFVVTPRAIQDRNACATWARKLRTTKKDYPKMERIHEELRHACFAIVPKPGPSKFLTSKE
ncbi:hypothetical protein NPIL_651501 [Nephila pilipes]|uniref:Uncharacterized protein n=1 Tax=Nephila pilipes TaxID=299642 RepID=A0A8X6KJR0_NEPPI|nr:hypothetical protein NPIL_651501 [Nephila pilipes]